MKKCHYFPLNHEENLLCITVHEACVKQVFSCNDKEVSVHSKCYYSCKQSWMTYTYVNIQTISSAKGTTKGQSHHSQPQNEWKPERCLAICTRLKERPE